MDEDGDRRDEGPDEDRGAADGRPVRHRFEFAAVLWVWDARKTETWTFVSLPEAQADEILDLVGSRARGFGSVRVEVTLGGSVWRTSLFPDSTAGTYVLPVKRAVRTAEGLEPGVTARVRVELLDV
jgi:hypothetical protein